MIFNQDKRASNSKKHSSAATSLVKIDTTGQELILGDAASSEHQQQSLMGGKLPSWGKLVEVGASVPTEDMSLFGKSLPNKKKMPQSEQVLRESQAVADESTATLVGGANHTQLPPAPKTSQPSGSQISSSLTTVSHPTYAQRDNSGTIGLDDIKVDFKPWPLFPKSLR